MHGHVMTAVQLVGVVAALAGLFLLAGLAWALLTGGVALAVGCAVYEAMRPSGPPADRGQVA